MQTDNINTQPADFDAKNAALEHAPAVDQRPLSQRPSGRMRMVWVAASACLLLAVTVRVYSVVLPLRSGTVMVMIGSEPVPVVHAAAPDEPALPSNVYDAPPNHIDASSAASSDQAAAKPVPLHPDNHAGVYLTARSAGRDEKLNDTMTMTNAVHGNALVFDAKGNKVYFDTSAPMATSLGLTRHDFDLRHILDAAHAQHLYTIARYVAVSDEGLTSALPETQLHDPNTNMVITPGYIDPQNEQALQYNSEVICDLAAAGVDEINLDYIRFSTSNIYATDVYSPAEKSARVGAFIQMARNTIDRCHPSTKLGISTFAILGWDYEKNLRTLGQDIKAFGKIVDVVSPMAYPSMFNENAYYDPTNAMHSRDYTLVYQTLKGYQDLLGADAWKLRPWLQGYFVTNKNVSDQIQATMDAGSCGFTFWNANNNYDPVYKAMKAWTMPERCL